MDHSVDQGRGQADQFGLDRSAQSEPRDHAAECVIRRLVSRKYDLTARCRYVIARGNGRTFVSTLFPK